jgi:hypothetical protein
VTLIASIEGRLQHRGPQLRLEGFLAEPCANSTPASGDSAKLFAPDTQTLLDISRSAQGGIRRQNAVNLIKIRILYAAEENRFASFVNKVA